ncbi:MAG TPA: response regulator transcription factor [Ktedonobacteraceae bacterium]|nr:response regulator transcription factor [Ktedonobacteraceae bacterium]
MIKVFVVAPTPMLQAGLHTMLTAPDIQVVGTAAVPALAEDLPNIDVIVVADDLQLEDVGRALTDTPKVALVILTQDNERVLRQLRSLELPGWAIVSLDAPAVQLQAAITATAQGFVAVPSQVANRLYEQHPSAVEALNLAVSDESLTPREREVLELVGQGLPNKMIARQLHISEHTVKFHVSSISTKLGASSRTDAVRRGLRRGLITL